MGSLGHDSSKVKQDGEGRQCSRRGLFKGTAAFLAGGGLGTLASCSPSPVPDAPPLPWQWTELDPLEAGRRA